MSVEKGLLEFSARAALLVIGLGRIVVGIFAKFISFRLRIIEVGAGLLGTAITITVMLFYHNS